MKVLEYQKQLEIKFLSLFFTTKPVGEGSGLGLSVAHGIIKSHRGKLTCGANYPKGTIFTLTLPLKQ